MKSEYLTFLQNLRNDLYNRSNFKAAAKVQLQINKLK